MELCRSPRTLRPRATPRPGASAGRRHSERRRHRGPRRRRRARQARAAGARPDRGRLRAVRGRRRPEDWLVHANPGSRRRPRKRRRPPRLPGCCSAGARPGESSRRGPGGHRDRLPRPGAREPQARGAGGAGVPRRQGGDAELRRHLRHRPVAEAARPVHAQRRRRAPGAEPDGHRQQPGFNSPEMQQQRAGGECGGDVSHQRGEQRHGRRGRGKHRRGRDRGRRRQAGADGRPASCPASRKSSAISPGYIADRRAGRDRPDARPAAGTQERHPPFRRADDHDRSRRGCSMASSTPPTAPTSASTPSTPPACARRASSARSATWWSAPAPPATAAIRPTAAAAAYTKGFSKATRTRCAAIPRRCSRSWRSRPAARRSTTPTT